MYVCKSTIAFPIWYASCPYCEELIAIEYDIFYQNDSVICVCEYCKKRINIIKEKPDFE